MLVNTKLHKLLIKYFLFSLFLTAIIYLYNLVINVQETNYFYCDEVINYQAKFFNNVFNFNYIFSCDEPKYFYILDNPHDLLNGQKNYYQQRPIYISFAIIIKYLITAVTNIFDIYFPFINQLSFLILQNLILTFQMIFLRFIMQNFNKEIYYNDFFISLIIFFNPMNKWSIFQPGHQNMTTLIFLIGVWIFQKNTYLSKPKLIILGLLFLTHRSSILLLIILLLKDFNLKKINKKHLAKSLTNSFIFFSPYFLFRLLTFISGNSSNDNQIEEYNQFFWLFDFFLGKETIYSGINNGWFCQKVPHFIYCYLIDNLKTLFYMSGLILILFILKYYSSSVQLKSQKMYPMYFTFGLFFLFWMIIGWYPPIRFSFYSFGNFLLVLYSLLLFSHTEFKIRVVILLPYVFYFLPLNHWNSPSVIDLTIIQILAYLTTLFLMTLNLSRSRNS